VTLSLTTVDPSAVYVWRNLATNEILSTDTQVILDDIQSSISIVVAIMTDDCIQNNNAQITIEVLQSFTAEPTLSYVLAADCSPSDLNFDAGIANPNGLVLSYAWTGPNGYASSEANPIIQAVDASFNGTYTLVVSATTGCSTSKSITINNIDNPPLQPQIIGLSEICSGEEVQLSIPQFIGTNIVYTWDLPGTADDVFGMGTNQITIRPAAQNHDGDYKVNISIDGRCTLESTVFNLNVHESINVEASASNDICIAPGQDVLLSATISGGEPNSTYEYLWSGPSNFVSNVQSPILASGTIINGTYEIKVTDENGCSTIGSVNVQSQIQPVASAKALTDTEVCKGESITFTATSSMPNSTFIWYDGDPDAAPAGQEIGQGESITVNSLAVGSHEVHLKAFSITGCRSENIAKVAVQINDQPILDLGNTNILETCSGNSISLEAPTVVDAVYYWSGPNGYTSNVEDPIILNVNNANTGTYNLQLDVNGCLSNIDQVAISVNPEIVQPLTNGSGDNCSGGDFQLAVSNVNTALTYTWYQVNSNTPRGTGATIRFNNLSQTDEGEYYVIASQNGCSSIPSQSFFVEVVDNSGIVANAGDDFSTCFPDASLNAIVSAGTQGRWSVLTGSGTLVNPSQPTTVVNDLSLGANTFQWSIEDAICGTTVSDIVEIFFEGIISAEDDFVTIDQARDTSINVIANDSVYSRNLDITIIDNPDGLILAPQPNGTIDIQALGASASQASFTYEICSDLCLISCEVATVAIKFTTSDCTQVPNVVTPDGDGANDYFNVPCLEVYEGSLLKIFDRFGKIVFKDENYQNNWEGTWDNQGLDPGTYFYVIDVNDGKNTRLSGYVYLIK